VTATSDLMTLAAGTTEHDDAASNASQSRPETAVWEQRGACTLEDRNIMFEAGVGHEKGTFAENCASCGSAAVNFRLQWQPDRFRQCLQKKLPLTDGCAMCFSVTGEYGLNNCKSACFRSWCGKACLQCAETQAAERNECVGFAPPITWACDDSGYGRPISTAAPTTVTGSPTVTTTETNAARASATGWELARALPIGHDVSLFSVANSRFLRMKEDKIDAGAEKSTTVGIEDSERFTVVDANGDGLVALYCKAYGRFVTVNLADDPPGWNVKASSPVANASAPKDGWTAEPLVVMTTFGSTNNLLTVKIGGQWARDGSGGFISMGPDGAVSAVKHIDKGSRFDVVDHGSPGAAIRARNYGEVPFGGRSGPGVWLYASAGTGLLLFGFFCGCLSAPLRSQQSTHGSTFWQTPSAFQTWLQ